MRRSFSKDKYQKCLLPQELSLFYGSFHLPKVINKFFIKLALIVVKICPSKYSPLTKRNYTYFGWLKYLSKYPQALVKNVYEFLIFTLKKSSIMYFYKNKDWMWILMNVRIVECPPQERTFFTFSFHNFAV